MLNWYSSWQKAEDQIGHQSSVKHLNTPDPSPLPKDKCFAISDAAP